MFQVFLFRSRQHIGLNAHELDMTQICGCKPFNDMITQATPNKMMETLEPPML